MRLSLRHMTRYDYPSPRRGLVQSLRLTPSRFDGQHVLDWRVTVEGAVMGSAFRDGAGDWTETASLLGPVGSVAILAEGVVETRDLAGVLKGHREAVRPDVYRRAGPMTAPTPGLAALLAEADRPASDDLDRAHRLAAAVAEAVAYRPGETTAATTAGEALELGRGVCQDHTHVLIALALMAGLPARYAVGYLHAAEGPHEESHAWAELWLTGLGWVGFDAANRCCPNDRYVRLCSGRDADTAAPIRGIATGAVTTGSSESERMEVAVSVQEQAQ